MGLERVLILHLLSLGLEKRPRAIVLGDETDERGRLQDEGDLP